MTSARFLTSSCLPGTLPFLFAAALCACATVDDDPPAAIDAGQDPDAPVEELGCGNEVIEPGEACDGPALNGADCVSRGFENGALACDPQTCAFDTSGCYTCGDGVRGGAEECEGLDLGGQTCQGLGYLGGALACDQSTCTYDITTCDTREVLQNHDDTCFASLGCGDMGGTLGNPQHMFECFRDVVIPPPFWLTTVDYRIDTGTPAPAALDLEVYAWSGSGAPETRLATVPLIDGDLTGGAHSVQLAEPIQVENSAFCVALSGTDPMDGFRVNYSTTAASSETSWFKASTCGVSVTTEVSAVLGSDGTWCMSATVDKVLPVMKP